MTIGILSLLLKSQLKMLKMDVRRASNQFLRECGAVLYRFAFKISDIKKNMKNRRKVNKIIKMVKEQGISAECGKCKA